MKNNMNDFPSIDPVESYEAPKIPTFSDTYKDASILKALPSRWKQNAKVIACAGIIGAATLSGCVSARDVQNNDEAEQYGYVEQIGDDGDNDGNKHSGDDELNGGNELSSDDGQNGNDWRDVDYRQYGDGSREDDSRQNSNDEWIFNYPQDITYWWNFDGGQNVEDDWDDYHVGRVFPTQINYNGYTEIDLELRSHMGGGGWASYIVYLTEQEALGIIRSQLEAAGLDFGAQQPDNKLTLVNCESDGRNSFVIGDTEVGWCCDDGYWCWELKVGIDLLDSEKGVAVSATRESYLPDSAATVISDGFAVQLPGIRVGLFLRPNQTIGSGGYERDEELGTGFYNWPNEDDMEAKVIEDGEAIALNLISNLTEQTQQFIALLREEGIL